MNFAIISSFPPFRGGIPQETEILYNALIKEKNKVKIFSFKRQYPSIIFPGKNQYIDNYNNKKKYNVLYELDTINPISWNKVSNEIIKDNFDVILFRFWHPFFIPAFNYIKNKLKKKKSEIKIFCICDNVYPHERFLLDTFLLKIFFKKIDGFFVMSSNVEKQLKEIKPYSNIKKIFLPIKDNLGRPISKKDALTQLNLNDSFIFLFFGLIRDYKGLDILLKSLSHYILKDKKFKLLIVGECYDKKSKYDKIIKKFNLYNYVLWIDKYIDDKEIKLYFCACDVLVLPYKKASQSGIIPIAYNFKKIILASDIDGLNDYILKNETGYLFKPHNSKDLANKMFEISQNHDFNKSVHSIEKYIKNFSSKKLVLEMESFINDI